MGVILIPYTFLFCCDIILSYMAKIDHLIQTNLIRYLRYLSKISHFKIELFHYDINIPHIHPNLVYFVYIPDVRWVM